MAQAAIAYRDIHDEVLRIGQDSLELSVVIPCLNEADTLEVCLTKAQRALRDAGIRGEIIVADNGSSDASIEIAQRLGARVINVEAKGYGNALMGGIEAAHGRYVLMGDADDSYDFLEIPRFVDKLREGFDIVQGCRLPAGGGKIMPGAMPFSHRWCGNPAFSFIARWWFRAPINDIYCGMRAFTKQWYDDLDQRCTGMEFATEMIIKSSRYGARISEVPITLHRDGRKSHPPHLKTFRDGWRTLRFFLMYSPKWLFLVPGQLLILLGILGFALALPGVTIHGIRFSAHTLVCASLSIMLGYQSILFAIGIKTFAIAEKLLPRDTRMDRFFKVATLERGLILGAAAMLFGFGLLGAAVAVWVRKDFGNLNYDRTMRWVIPGATLIACGFQTVLSAFFTGILGTLRK
jgi:glycosyltransferase involved in cell wall biosynthesis